MSTKKWFVIFMTELAVLVIGISMTVVIVDPYFHYHKPVGSMFYTLDNERYQNDGIVKHFDYDSIITGSSMAENFKVSEFNEIFQAEAVKVCFSGASYKEINDNLKRAFASGHEIKYILRALDLSILIQDKDCMRTDLGEYPTYLYDRNPFNDVRYVMNKDIFFRICMPMITRAYVHGVQGGITSFDIYSNWNKDYPFGIQSILGKKREFIKAEQDMDLTEAEKETVKSTIRQNVTELADKHPETVFYCFFTPYSIGYWGRWYEEGTLDRQIDAEKTAIEEMLKCKNIKIYSFNDKWDITTDFDNYRDYIHYGEWINTRILHMIHDGEGLITKDNYEDYIEREREFYSGYIYQFYDLAGDGI